MGPQSSPKGGNNCGGHNVTFGNNPQGQRDLVANLRTAKIFLESNRGRQLDTGSLSAYFFYRSSAMLGGIHKWLAQNVQSGGFIQPRKLLRASRARLVFRFGGSTSVLNTVHKIVKVDFLVSNSSYSRVAGK